MKKVTRYKCDFCAFLRATKKTVQEHEKICFHNEESKSCATCIYLIDECRVIEDEKLTEQLKSLGLVELVSDINGNFDDYYIAKQRICLGKLGIILILKKLTTQCPYHKSRLQDKELHNKRGEVCGEQYDNTWP